MSIDDDTDLHQLYTKDIMNANMIKRINDIEYLGKRQMKEFVSEQLSFREISIDRSIKKYLASSDFASKLVIHIYQNRKKRFKNRKKKMFV